MTKPLLFLAALLLSFHAFAGAKVEIYNYPPEMQASQKYAVSIENDPVLVIPLNPGGCSVTPDPSLNMGVSNADEPEVAVFGAGGKVTVKVKFLQGAPSKVDVRPLAKNYTYSLKGDELTLQLKTYDRVSVEADGNIDAPLFIFVNPLEATAVAAARNDPETQFFGEGKIYTSDCFQFYKKKIYVQGGAVLNGFLFHKKENSDCELRGCGILDSRKEERNGAINIHNIDNLTISNITVLNKFGWTVRLNFCDNFIIDNVKAVSHCPYNDNWDENDGIHPVACKGGLISRCFAYSWDDAYNITSSFFNNIGEVRDIELNDCIAWNVHPGNSFEISWSTKEDIHDILYKNVYAIHSGTKRTYLRAGIAIHHGGPASVYNVKYENVWIEDPQEYGLALTLLKNGQMHDISFKNIHILKTPPFGCLLRGSGEEHQVHDISFNNLEIEGKKITSVEDEGFRSERTPAKNYYNVTFK